jgi:hypothetical protein
MFPVPFPVPGDTPGDRDKLDGTRVDVRSLRETITDLQRRLEKQAVLVRALFALLSAKLGLTEAELLDHFRSAEKERASATAKMCAHCGRAVHQRTHRCIYCGVAAEVESAFEFLELGAWTATSPTPTRATPRSTDDHRITSRPGD